MAHHGSLFLSKIRPKVALISVGRNNRYGHPSAETIEGLDAVSAKILRTDISGAIHIRVDKKGRFSAVGWKT